MILLVLVALLGCDGESSEEELTKNLYEAALIGDEKKMDDLISKGADINGPYIGKENLPPLHRAADDLNPEAVKLLLKKGADINLEVDGGFTPLLKIYYSNKGNYNDRSEMIRELVEKGANPNIESVLDDKWLLHSVVGLTDKEQALNLTKSILEKSEKADIDIRGPKGETAIYYALFANSRVSIEGLDIVRYLLSKNANIELKIEKHGTKKTIIQIIEDTNGDQEDKNKILSLLKGNNVETPNSMEMDKLTQNLYEAALIGDEKKMDDLISKGADINGPYIGKENLPPLHRAADDLNPEAVKLLLKKGANPNLEVIEVTPITPIVVAYFSGTDFAKNKDVELLNIFQELLNNGADPNVLAYDAIFHYVDEEEDKLAGYGKCGYLIHEIAKSGDKKFALAILNNLFEEGDNRIKVNINIRREPFGKTALYNALSYKASREGSFEDNLAVVEYLMSKGADPKLIMEVGENKHKKSILELFEAKKMEDKEKSEVLKTLREEA